jgi:alkanesulfonate monooxygenase SsuD/methylene tetrahydromethanopterin reductase-like flavin-dependent oxidoreductase (luciferase family)
VCVAVEGRFLHARSVADLRQAALRAVEDGKGAIFVVDGPLGEATELAAALSVWVADVEIGVAATLGPAPHRHPALLAREMTTLDLLSRGRTMLAFRAPFDDATAEGVALCRTMWREGTAASEGPHYPVAGAINRPGPHRGGGPPIALDLTDGSEAPPGLVDLVDFVLVPSRGDFTLQPV